MREAVAVLLMPVESSSEYCILGLLTFIKQKKDLQDVFGFRWNNPDVLVQIVNRRVSS